MNATCVEGLRHDMGVSSSSVRFGMFLQSALTTEFERANLYSPFEKDKMRNADDDSVLRTAQLEVHFYHNKRENKTRNVVPGLNEKQN